MKYRVEKQENGKYRIAKKGAKQPEVKKTEADLAKGALAKAMEAVK